MITELLRLYIIEECLDIDHSTKLLTVLGLGALTPVFNKCGLQRFLDVRK